MQEKSIPTIDILKTGLNIKQIMNRKNISVRDVQDYLGLATPQCIYHWFKGRNMPSVDHLYVLSEMFRMPMDELITGSRTVKFQYREDEKYNRWCFYYKCFAGLLAG